MAKEKFIIEPHFRLHEWVAEEKGYFKDEGLDYDFQELFKSTDGAHHYRATRSARCRSFERGRKSDVSCACHWTVERRRLEGPRQALWRCLFGLALRRVRAAGIRRSRSPRISPACRSRSATSRAATTRPSRRSSSTCRADKINLSLRRRHAVSPAGAADRRQGAGLGAVQRARTTSPSSSASARSSTPPS